LDRKEICAYCGDGLADRLRKGRYGVRWICRLAVKDIP